MTDSPVCGFMIYVSLYYSRIINKCGKLNIQLIKNIPFVVKIQFTNT